MRLWTGETHDLETGYRFGAGVFVAHVVDDEVEHLWRQGGQQLPLLDAFLTSSSISFRLALSMSVVAQIRQELLALALSIIDVE